MISIVELPPGPLKGLDDFLLEHSIDEFKALPTIKVKTLFERVAEATPENYKPLVPEIAKIEDEIERELLCKSLAKRTGVSYFTIKRTIKTLTQKQAKRIDSDNIIISHPSYEINESFMSLGFRKTVIINDCPSDVNFYIVSNEEGCIIHEDKTLQIDWHKVIFNERDRILIEVNDKWDYKKISSFIKSPVAPANLFWEIKNILKQYIEFQKEAAYGLITAWIIATYFNRCFHAFPFLFFYGKKQSGKTRSLDLLALLAFHAMKMKGVSVAALSDSIDGIRGCFLMDQAEILSDKRNVELLGILADSYTMGGGKRRIVDISNKKRRILEFETYGPKVFASIKDIDDDLKDRCILIPMLRAKRDYPYPEAHLPLWAELRDKLYRLSLIKWRDVKEIYETAGQGVIQRIRELWRPIETVLILEDVPEKERRAIKNVFLESMQETQTELSDHEHALFQALFELLDDESEGVFTVSEIAERIEKDDDISMKSLTIWIGRMLRQFSLYDKPAGRKERKRAYHFTLDRIKDVFVRYHASNGFNGLMVNDSENSRLEATIEKSHWS